jgi:hypothetical protein
MLIDLQNQHSCDFDCQNRNSLLEYIALGRSSGVIASEAKQSGERRAPTAPGSPRRFARRDDGSIRTQH